MSSSVRAGRTAVPLNLEQESPPQVQNPAQQLWAEIKSWRRLLSRTHEFEKLADDDLEEATRPGTVPCDAPGRSIPFSCFKCYVGF